MSFCLKKLNFYKFQDYMFINTYLMGPWREERTYPSSIGSKGIESAPGAREESSSFSLCFSSLSMSASKLSRAEIIKIRLE